MLEKLGRRSTLDDLVANQQLDRHDMAFSIIISASVVRVLASMY